MTALADRSLREILDEVAAGSPAPGGGSAAATACALGAALVEMSARIGPGEATPAGAPSRPRGSADRAAELRDRALELAERELSSYRPVLDALRLPREQPGRAKRLDDALVEASEAPLAIAQTAADAAALAAEVADLGDGQVRGDAIVAAVLAEAAARSALSLVEINLAGRPTDPRLAEARAAAELASSARRRALGGE